MAEKEHTAKLTHPFNRQLRSYLRKHSEHRPYGIVTMPQPGKTAQEGPGGAGTILVAGYAYDGLSVASSASAQVFKVGDPIPSAPIAGTSTGLMLGAQGDYSQGVSCPSDGNTHTLVIWETYPLGTIIETVGFTAPSGS